MLLNRMEHRFENTAVGAKEALSMMSVFKPEDMKDAYQHSDGVWVITRTNGFRCIVYLSGYGGNRFNDFESEQF